MEILENIFYCGEDSEKYYCKITKIIKNNEILYWFDNSNMEYKYFNNKDIAFHEMFIRLGEIIDNLDFDDVDSDNEEDVYDYFISVNKKYVDEYFFKSIKNHNIVCVNKGDNVFLLTNALYQSYKNKFETVINK